MDERLINNIADKLDELTLAIGEVADILSEILYDARAKEQTKDSLVEDKDSDPLYDLFN